MSTYQHDNDQGQAEALDASLVATDPYTLSTAEYPPDMPQGVEEYGTTAQEERIDEPLAERLEREEPDPLVVELDAAAAREEERAFARMVAERAELSAEERSAGSEVPADQARVILEESELRALEREIDPWGSGERRTSDDVTAPR